MIMYMDRTAITTTESLDMLALGNLLALTLSGREPDERVQHTADGTRLEWLGEGILEVSPPDGRGAELDLVLSAGVHGCEVVPIMLLDRLIQAIGRGDIHPRARLLFLFCNPPAMRQKVRRVGKDLNRLFCGRHAGEPSEEALRASQLEAAVAAFFHMPCRRRWHYDLHSAMRASQLPQFAISPWVPKREISSESLARLLHAGVDALLIQEKPSRTFSAHTATHHGAEAFTLEMAEAPGDTWPSCLDDFLQAAQGWIEAIEPVPAGTLRPLLRFRLAREIIKHSERFALRLPEDIENFTPIAPGLLLAEDKDGTRWVVEEQDARILFPMADVAVGERAGLIVVPRD